MQKGEKLKKYILSIVFIAFIVGFSGCGGGSTAPTLTDIVGAATDDYIIDADVDIYNSKGDKISSNCKTEDFGYFSCEVSDINSDEQVIIVVKNGKVDSDGNASTKSDQSDFTGSLMAVTQNDKAIIVSPMTSKVVVNAIGKDDSLVVDTDKNLSYIKGDIDIENIVKKSKEIFNIQKNLPQTHILKTKKRIFIQNQAKSITQTLDNNITIIKDTNMTSKDFKIEILHINDTHSHLEPIMTSIKIGGKRTYVDIGGYARIAKYIKDKKSFNPHTIALHAGDAVQGTLYYTLFDGKADIEALNLMDLDAMTIGNHEFDKGADNFGENFADSANFAIVSCDINASKNKILKNIIKPYIIKEIDGKKVAIVGDSINSSIVSDPGPTIAFSNYIKSANRYIDILKKEGIDKIIFLTHIGYNKDMILAQQAPEIDVIVGGHSHTLLGDFSDLGITSYGDYPTIEEHNNSKTLIVSAWKWGEIVGDISVVFDDKGVVKYYNANPVMLVDDKFLRKNSDGKKIEVDGEIKKQIENQISLLPNITIESEEDAVKNVINKYKPKVDALMSEAVATANSDLINVRLPGGFDYESGKTLPNGSMIAPHVALAMYDKAKDIGECDFALQNAGGVRITVPKGDITIGEVYTLLPFANTLVTLKMEGKYIKSMLENAIDRSLIKRADTGAFPYLANAKITIDKDRDTGERIVKFQIKNKEGKWIDFDENKTYTIATNSYVAGGGDYYKEMNSYAIQKIDTGYIDAEIFLEYIKKKKILSPLEADEVPVSVQDQ